MRALVTLFSIPFGAGKLEAPPVSTCVPGTEQGVKWACEYNPKRVDVKVLLREQGGVYYGWEMSTEGYDRCLNLADWALSLLGDGTVQAGTGVLAVRTWSEGSITAAFGSETVRKPFPEPSITTCKVVVEDRLLKGAAGG